jgi:hypothetical protein
MVVLVTKETRVFSFSPLRFVYNRVRDSKSLDRFSSSQKQSRSASVISVDGFPGVQVGHQNTVTSMVAAPSSSPSTSSAAATTTEILYHNDPFGHSLEPDELTSVMPPATTFEPSNPSPSTGTKTLALPVPPSPFFVATCVETKRVSKWPLHGAGAAVNSGQKRLMDVIRRLQDKALDCQSLILDHFVPKPAAAVVKKADVTLRSSFKRLIASTLWLQSFPDQLLESLEFPKEKEQLSIPSSLLVLDSLQILDHSIYLEASALCGKKKTIHVISPIKICEF